MYNIHITLSSKRAGSKHIVLFKCEALLRLGISARPHVRTYELTSTQFTPNFKDLTLINDCGFRT